MATKVYLKKVAAVGVLPLVTVERRHHWCHVQARRQDLAAGGAKNQKRGPHLKNTIQDACSNQGAKREMRGPGTTGPSAGDGPGHVW